MKLYEVRNTVNKSVYVGITRNSLGIRWAAHKSAAKRGKKSILYDAMRSFGIEVFSIHLIGEFESEEALLQAEKDLISYHRNSLEKSYNILDGGTSYFPIKDVELWKSKLRNARVGRKPALGMQHSEENKLKFSEAGKLRWDIYGRYPDEVTQLSFSDANKKHGISKTHYYRLRKQAPTTEGC